MAEALCAMLEDANLSRHFLAPYALGSGGRLGELCHSRSGPLDLTRVRIDALDVASIPDPRSPAHARLDMKFVRRGAVRVVAHNRQVVIKAGQMMLLDHGEPFTVKVDSDTDCLCVTMPTYWLMRQNPRYAQVMFKIIERDHPFAATMQSFLQDWEAARDGPSQLIGVQFGGLLSIMAAYFQRGGAQPASPLAETIIRTIREYSADPEINADTVAARLRISRRHLYATLAKANVIFGVELMAVRLEASYMILTNPEYNALQIGEVARLSGFHDSGHFSRCFRLRFGQSPRDARKGMLSRPQDAVDD